MGFVDHLHTSTITAPHHAGFKRPRVPEMTTTTTTLTLHYKDPPAAGADQQPADAGAGLVPFAPMPSRSPSINAVPLLSAGFKRPRVPEMTTTTTTLTLHYKDPPAAGADQQPADAGAGLVPFAPMPSRSPSINAVPLLSAGFKRPRVAETTTSTLTLYKDTSAGNHQQQPEDAGALVPFVPSRSPPIDAVPLSAVAPSSKRLASPQVAVEEPQWLRERLLPELKFRYDLPVSFIAEKAVTATDLVPHQNRFRLPSDGVMRNLRPVLSHLELKAANLLDEQQAPRLPRPPKLPKVPGEKGKKRKGKKHGGLPVLVVEPRAGIRELQLSRWDSSAGTVIKGEGYLDFIHSCGFKVDDVVQIWAFKETYFRLFGVDHCHDSPLHLLIVKKGLILPPS